MKLKIILFVLLSFNIAANEETKFDGSTIGITASTMGAGIEYTHPLSDDFSLSFGINKFSYTDEIKESDVNYSADIDFNSISLIANYNPFSDTAVFRNLRIRTGLYNNNNEISMSAKPNGGTITIDGISYSANGVSANAKVDFDNLSPYLGIGWGSSNSENAGIFGMNLTFDIGVIKTKVNAKLTGNCTLDAITCNNFQDSIDNENRDLQKELEDLDLYPIVKLGLSYSF